jgi:hypothetical protein
MFIRCTVSLVWFVGEFLNLMILVNGYFDVAVVLIN